MTEKRLCTRVKLQECVSIRYGTQVFFADTQDVSLQGIYVRTEQDLPLHATINVTLYHAPAYSIHVQGDVVRREPGGFGMKIRQMDVNSFTCLRNIVTVKCNDYELTMRETLKASHCIQ